MLRFLIATSAILVIASLPTQTNAQDCLISCPGEWGLPGHTPGSETDWVILDPDVNSLGFHEYIPDPGAYPLPGYICVCEEECDLFPMDYPRPGTDSFRWRGSVHSYPGDPRVWSWGGGGPWPIAELTVTSVDLNCDCEVTLADFVIFANAWVNPPPIPSFEMYACFTTCEVVPPARPVLSDFVVFSRHFGHGCTPAGGCDP